MPIKVEDHQDTCHLQTQSVTEKFQEERDDQGPLHQIIETTGTPENIEKGVTEIVLGHHYQEETEIRTDLDSVKGDQDQDLELHQGEKIVIDQAPVEEHNIAQQTDEKDLDQEAAKEDPAHLHINEDHIE